MGVNRDLSVYLNTLLFPSLHLCWEYVASTYSREDTMAHSIVCNMVLAENFAYKRVDEPEEGVFLIGCEWLCLRLVQAGTGAGQGGRQAGGGSGRARASP